jgi:hypothetical protein
MSYKCLPGVELRSSLIFPSTSQPALCCCFSRQSWRKCAHCSLAQGFVRERQVDAYLRLRLSSVLLLLRTERLEDDLPYVKGRIWSIVH